MGEVSVENIAFSKAGHFAIGLPCRFMALADIGPLANVRCALEANFRFADPMLWNSCIADGKPLSPRKKGANLPAI
jgi:hypothetical protein